MPDGIDARDATIGLLEEDIERLTASLSAQVTESERLRTALTEARAGEDELAGAARNLLNCCERHGLAKDLMAEIWPEGRDPNRKATWSDSAREARQYMNELKGPLASHAKRKEGR